MLQAVCCRICLTYEPGLNWSDLITPCRCRGEREFVHRRCLDQLRVKGRGVLAFSHCEACMQQYEIDDMGQAEGRCACMAVVARDTLVVFVALVLAAAVLGVVVRAIDRDQYLVKHMPDQIADSAKATYMVCGTAILLVLIGACSGCIMQWCFGDVDGMPVSYYCCYFCCIDCDDPTPHEYQGRCSSDDCDGTCHSLCCGREPRPQEERQRHNDDGCCHPGDCGRCSGGCPSMQCGDCGCAGGGGGGDACALLLGIIVVLLVALAVIGVFALAFMAIGVIQRVIQRYARMVVRRQDAKRYRVRDLRATPAQPRHVPVLVAAGLGAETVEMV